MACTKASVHLQCAMPTCRNCRGARLRDQLFNETQELFNRRNFLDAMTVGPDENGVLHGFSEYQPKHTPDLTTHVPTDLKKFRKEARKSTQTQSLEKELKVCPSDNTSSKEDIAQNRKLHLELLKRKVAREDMRLFRGELYGIITEERIARREGNGRNKLMETVMMQCIKLIDLWEEGCSEMDVITEKNEYIAKRKQKMEQKANQRLGLEKDNQGLRDAIADLRQKLETTRDSNIRKGLNFDKVSCDNQDETTKNKNLNAAVNKARKGQQTLATAMTQAESSLVEAFKPFEDATEPVALEN